MKNKYLPVLLQTPAELIIGTSAEFGGTAAIPLTGGSSLAIAGGGVAISAHSVAQALLAAIKLQDNNQLMSKNNGKGGGKEEFIYFGKNKILKSLFHGPGGIKEKILKALSNKKYEWKVGKNPDIDVKQGKIYLKGTGDFRGKSMPTDLNSKDFLGF